MHSNPTFIKAEFKRAYQAVLKEYKKDGDSPMACEIHNYLGDDNHHNCIGCNLADTEEHIFNNLKKYRSFNDLREASTTHLLLCYIMVERIDEVFKIINIPESYRIQYFNAFSIIKKWANFIKHPKAFILVHHPEYLLENDPELPIIKKDSIKIDTDFIKTYYSGSKNNPKLYSLLTNKKDVYVILPELAPLTKSFFEEIRLFINLIRDNSVYRHLLNDKSTFENYFISEQDDDL